MRSGEFLTTAFLWGYAAVLILIPGSTFATSRGFAWVIAMTRGHEELLGAWAVALGVVAPYAVWRDDGRLRVLGVASQGALYCFLGCSFAINSTLGLGWVTFVVCGGWLLWRAATLLGHHARRGWGGGA